MRVPESPLITKKGCDFAEEHCTGEQAGGWSQKTEMSSELRDPRFARLTSGSVENPNFPHEDSRNEAQSSDSSKKWPKLQVSTTPTRTRSLLPSRPSPPSPRYFRSLLCHQMCPCNPNFDANETSNKLHQRYFRNLLLTHTIFDVIDLGNKITLAVDKGTGTVLTTQLSRHNWTTNPRPNDGVCEKAALDSH